ncbi:MAG: type 1 periplasmic binding fold superfamily protein [[Chlorobium] sp. 445]|nr:MAG: type 1 periplasmic binding fold superfamily protein [[Chlorobium] sp. 445]
MSKMKLYTARNILSLFLVAIMLVTTVGCRQDNPVDTNEQEKITTLKLKLTPAEGRTIEAVWRDLDGPGGNPPVITPLNLRAGVTYDGEVEVLDESKVPPEDKTEEIEEEGDEHLFTYTVGGGAQGRLTITRTDRDRNDLEIGLRFRAQVSSGAATSGTLRVILYHYSSSVRKTPALQPGPETDIDATFPVNIAQ